MILRLKVNPGRSFNAIVWKDNLWIVRLNAPAVDGKANKALVHYLATILHLPESSVVLKKGSTSPFKTLEINATAELVLNILDGESKK